MSWNPVEDKRIELLPYDNRRVRVSYQTYGIPQLAIGTLYVGNSVVMVKNEEKRTFIDIYSNKEGVLSVEPL